VRSLSCVSSTFCYAVGESQQLGDSESTYQGWVFDGSTWTETILFGFEVDYLSCVSSTRCVGVGSDGLQPVSTHFDGSTWHGFTNFGDTTAAATALSCQTTTFCIATDNRGRAQRYDRARWSAPATVASASLSDISCVQAGTCLAVGPAAGVVQYVGNGRWKPPVTIDKIGGLTAISCPASDFCMAVDDRGYVITGRAS